ncbi:hypothetical protein ncot_14535 [Nocardioides sp. JQ2195]|uniref:anti-sigma factor family protein n=1 Tax=Nocardioides sp. JQ2195 TaxID=2592334 RepID=UPI00143E6660|nr:zf-HC2 domain-containing protein [Nocardioides sp. JQ2195]QIX27677.1 hypothetical protein ncot_14535 [Nocardioides sp. JQ2195]
MIGHVGAKVSALIDGQLPAAESERLWNHVHGCASCRQHVEREGWIKTRLAGLGGDCAQPAAPNYLHSVLCHSTRYDTDDPVAEPPQAGVRRRTVAVAVLGAGSMGAAMLGVFALTIPAEAPPVDRRGPTTSLTGVSDSLRPAVPVATTEPVGATSNSAQTSVVDGPAPRWVTINK